MKYWMFAFSCLALLPASLSFSAPESSPAVTADKLFRQGIAHCNQASRQSRQNTRLARSEFNQYLSFVERAKTVYPAFMNHNSFVRREHKRCALVEDNIARAEAMPLVEESLAQCSNAKKALQSNDLTAATKEFNQYQALRDDAVNVTPTVLRVGSVAVRMRMCDRLIEKISLAKTEQGMAAQKADKLMADYNRALVSCSASDGMLTSGANSLDTMKAAEHVLAQVQTIKNQADSKAAALFSRGAHASQLAAMRDRVVACTSGVVAKLTHMRATVEQAELALAAAETSSVSNAADATAQDVSVLKGQEIVQIGNGDL